jgi:hypothetical protein
VSRLWEESFPPLSSRLQHFALFYPANKAVAKLASLNGGGKGGRRLLEEDEWEGAARMVPDAVKYTLSILAFGNVGVAARDYQKVTHPSSSPQLPVPPCTAGEGSVVSI